MLHGRGPQRARPSLEDLRRRGLAGLRLPGGVCGCIVVRWIVVVCELDEKLMMRFGNGLRGDECNRRTRAGAR